MAGVGLDVVFFELRGRRCALPVATVREVLPMPSVTPVPLAPPCVRGLAAVHGHAIPVLDLGLWFSAKDSRLDPPPFRSGSDKLILVEATAARDPAPTRVALVVERVMRLGTIDEEHSRPAPPGPTFVIATVLDIDGPALLVSADQALDHVRAAIVAAVQS